MNISREKMKEIVKVCYLIEANKNFRMYYQEEKKIVDFVYNKDDAKWGMASKHKIYYAFDRRAFIKDILKGILDKNAIVAPDYEIPPLNIFSIIEMLKIFEPHLTYGNTKEL